MFQDLPESNQSLSKKKTKKLKFEKRKEKKSIFTIFFSFHNIINNNEIPTRNEENDWIKKSCKIIMMIIMRYMRNFKKKKHF